MIAIDTVRSESAQLADVVLAASAFGEKSGTTTNLEGRVTRVRQCVTPAGTSRPDWMIASELALELGHDLGFDSVDSVTAAIAANVPAYAGVTAAALDAAGEGVIALIPATSLPTATVPEIAPSGYDFRLVVSRKLYDRAVGTALSPSLALLAVGAGIYVNPADVDKIGVAVGADVRVAGAKGAVVLPLHQHADVPRGTAWAPFNQTGSDIADIIDSSAAVTDVTIGRLE